MARIRNVWPTEQIAHMWAHQTQFSARNYGNFHYEGRNLYSYNTVIAVRLETRKGIAFMLASRSWSSTTNKHQQEARRAVFGTVFTVADIHADTLREHKMNLQLLINHAEETAVKATRARSQANYYAASVVKQLEHAREYARYFNVRSPKVPDLDVAGLALAAKERTAKATAQETARQAEQRKARQAYDEMVTSQMPLLIRQWRAGQDSLAFLYNSHEQRVSTYALTQANGGALMRLSGNVVETNQNATVPADQVRRLAPVLLHVMTNAPERCAEFIGKHVGSFAIRAMDSETVNVGCHTFKREEIQHILDVLEHAEIVPAPEPSSV